MTDCHQLLDNVDLFIVNFFDVTWHNRVTLNIVLSVFMIGWSTAMADKLTSFTTTLF